MAGYDLSVGDIRNRLVNNNMFIGLRNKSYINW